MEAENNKAGAGNAAGDSGVAEWKCKEHAELVQKEVLPNLKRLEGDDDVDVRYYAATAAAKAGGIPDVEGGDAAAVEGGDNAAADANVGEDANNESTAMETSP